MVRSERMKDLYYIDERDMLVMITDRQIEAGKLVNALEKVIEKKGDDLCLWKVISDLQERKYGIGRLNQEMKDCILNCNGYNNLCKNYFSLKEEKELLI